MSRSFFHCGDVNKRFHWPYVFLLVKNYRISILIGYTVFLTSEENRIVILLTTWPPCWGRSSVTIYAIFYQSCLDLVGPPPPVLNVVNL